MTPPEAQGTRQPAEAPPAPPAVSVCVMKTRPEFLKAASARRQGAGSFLLQARDRRDGTDKVQIGFTASKKIGNAVARNRAKRRLREVARAVLPRLAQPGWDYVLVARPDATIARPFAALLADLEAALTAVHAPRGPRP
ncbi:ribonuclease P protein component [Pseudogemmobacter blasticus]|uniref:Ribonuclease P protein component n=1 Tax=Fuscovulum blasticum DSM 2131 TaxID=1188250 RepID=A0A2T4J736_FUSBL|nr:ribonuclease P protein component [Fuscovulum blasticum]PTE13637.1 ribonuclease P protein component [Fuscovulum blasticum DSM 2131]